MNIKIPDEYIEELFEEHNVDIDLDDIGTYIDIQVELSERVRGQLDNIMFPEKETNNVRAALND